MPEKKVFTDKNLTIDIVYENDEIQVIWSGRIDQRNPGELLIPILSELLQEAVTESYNLVWDFRGIAFLSSSSLIPLIRIIELIKGNYKKVKLKIIYVGSKKWQDLSLSALKMYETKDGQINVTKV